MSEMSQAGRTARETAAKADGFGEPARRRAWEAGRDYGREREQELRTRLEVEAGLHIGTRERERALETALGDLVEWCAGPLGLEGHAVADSNSHDEPINCLLSLGTLRAGIGALGKARAALAVSQPEVLSERSDTEPGEPEGQRPDDSLEPQEPCDHEFQMHPQSEDFGVCAICGESHSCSLPRRR